MPGKEQLFFQPENLVFASETQKRAIYHTITHAYMCDVHSIRRVYQIVNTQHFGGVRLFAARGGNVLTMK